MSLTSRKKRPLDHTVPYLRDTRLIVIATEGEKTEKQYFALFRHRRVQVHVLHTEDGCSSPRHVLNRLNEYRRRFQLKGDDQLWVVADVDSWPPQMLAEVAAAAIQKRFGLAISNPCFEIWLYLHHGDVDPTTALDKTRLEQLLRSIHGSYNSANIRTDRYRDNVEDAVDRAAALDASPKERWPSRNGTHVYKLAREILDLIHDG